MLNSVFGMLVGDNEVAGVFLIYLNKILLSICSSWSEFHKVDT